MKSLLCRSLPNRDSLVFILLASNEAEKMNKSLRSDDQPEPLAVRAASGSMVFKIMDVLHIDKFSGNPCFWCPGCRMVHIFHLSGNLVWTFTGSCEKPTFEPSLLNTSGPNGRRCHLVVTTGILNYCGDCSHELAGKSIPMVEWRGFDPENYKP